MTNIFIADDDAEDSSILAETMKIFDPSAVFKVFQNGNDLMNGLQNGMHPDLIFLDLNMPVMDGYAALGKIRQTSAFDIIPVIMYTTSSIPADVTTTLNSGADHYISKPVNYAQLKMVIQKVLALKINGKFTRSHGENFLIS